MPGNTVTMVYRNEAGELYGPSAERDFMCVACQRGFTPSNGAVNVVRRKPEDHPYPICAECLGHNLTAGEVQKDDTRVKCTCGTSDPDRRGCLVHEGSRLVH